MVDKVFCPVAKETGVCKQSVVPLEEKGEPTVIICGFWSERAGRCAVGLLADGLKAVHGDSDRIANAAEAIYAVLDPGDDED